MKKISIILVAIIVSALSLFAKDCGKNSELVICVNRAYSLNIKKELAIKLAEIYLMDIYGEKVLKQRPWIVSEDDVRFKIEGTFHGKGVRFGGVAEIDIRKSDGKVLQYSHGK